jgi:hypothetical protein
MSKIISRPKIVMNISTWEKILTVIHFLLFILIVGYYIKEWSNIPERILNSMIPNGYHRGGGVWRIEYVAISTLCHLCIAWAAIYNILLLDRNKYFKGKSVSSELSNAFRQYRVEASWLLCLTAAIRLILVTGNIVYIEMYLKHTQIFIHWWPQFFIAMGVIWLIHHILWTRLADK